jgi:hypothetical protein
LLDQRLSKALNADRRGSSPLSVFDIPGIKLVNDTLESDNRELAHEKGHGEDQYQAGDLSGVTKARPNQYLTRHMDVNIKIIDMYCV